MIELAMIIAVVAIFVGVRSTLKLRLVQRNLTDTNTALAASQDEHQKAEAKITAFERRLQENAQKLKEYGALTVSEIEQKTASARNQLTGVEENLRVVRASLEKARTDLVVTEESALLQEVGVYNYRHPLSSAASYQIDLKLLQEKIKQFNKDRERAISAVTGWTVNGSAAEGKRMVTDFSKLMLRAFNAEADTLVHELKPYKLERAVERLQKLAIMISKLGRVMSIQITHEYLKLRVQELELTADFLNKQADEKEAAREERARMQEERKAQAELERERLRLEKERRHYENALAVLQAKGDGEGAARLSRQIEDVDKALTDVDYRTANIRAGYVYVISNIGAFGESMVKIGMTRRLDPMDRVNELGDASVPFRFDVHALFFSKDAVAIETEMHNRLAAQRVNRINNRREFFCCTPADAKAHLTELAGELLEFTDEPEALEYRQSTKLSSGLTV